jgi:hypothetical protein
VKLLPVDTDVLLQVFKGGPPLLSVLRSLKKYALQPGIVGEVEGELAGHARYKDQFDGPTQKAIASASWSESTTRD